MSKTFFNLKDVLQRLRLKAQHLVMQTCSRKFFEAYQVNSASSRPESCLANFKKTAILHLVWTTVLFLRSGVLSVSAVQASPIKTDGESVPSESTLVSDIHLNERSDSISQDAKDLTTVNSIEYGSDNSNRAQISRNEDSGVTVPVEFVLPLTPLDPFPSDYDFTNISPELFRVFQEEKKPENVQFSVEASEHILKSNAQYKVIPQIVDKKQLPPFFTALSLNGVLINGSTEWQFSVGDRFGEGLSNNPVANGLYTLKSEIKQSLTQDNVFITDWSGLYLQLQTVTDRRKLTLTTTEPQTVNELQYQLSFTGPCSITGRFDITDSSTQCSLTPTLITDRDRIDPQTLQATNTFQTGNYGDPLSPETLAILAQPGFQNVGANGQTVGLDLFFPNTGASAGNSKTNQTSIARFDDLKNSYTLGLYRVRQIYKANADKAVLGRTVHGYTGILFDQNFPINFATQGLAQVFPDVIPHLKGDPARAANTALNQNLIFSANNTRLPENSFVIYQAGYGASNHAKRNQNHEPAATFNNFWLGLSPVGERQFTSSSSYVVTSPSRVIAAAGGEGGAKSSSAISIVSLIDLNNTVNQVLSSNLSDYYTQVYLTFFQKDVNRITKNELTEEFTYYPHLALTGNITQFNKVFRYYGGAIASPKPKAYLGLDFSYDLLRDVRWSSSIIGYLNPDRDYFSKAESRLEKIFHISSSVNLSVFTSFRYVFDRIADPGTGFYSNPVDNFFSFGATARLGPLTAGVTQFLDVLPFSVPTALGYSLSIDLDGHGSLSGYLSPQRGVTNYGAIALLKLNTSPNSPSLSFSWNRAMFNFGKDSFNNSLEATEDKFLLLFRIGSPTNLVAK